MYLRIKRFLRYVDKNRWEVLFSVLAVCFLLIFIYWGVNKVRTYWYNHDIKTNQEALVQKQQELSAVAREESYTRMQLSKYFTDKVKGANWYTTISYLINVFDKISGDTKKDLLISNLKIDLSTISLQGEVVNMDRVYASGGIIDRFQTMNFITEVDIPTYTKSPSGTYTFDLDAKIKNNDTGRSQ